jgi:hypothetical protein
MVCINICPKLSIIWFPFSNKNVHISDHFFPLLFPKDSEKGNQMMLSLGQILMQTILAPIFFEIFSGRYFSF